MRVWDKAMKHYGSWKGSDGAGDVIEQGIIGGERNTTSSTNNYDAVHEEVNKTLFNPDATTEQVITNLPCFVYGFMGRTGTGTLTLRDSATAAGATSDFPAFTLAVGTPVMLCGGAGVRFENGLTAQCGTGTDDCVIFWRPI